MDKMRIRREKETGEREGAYRYAQPWNARRGVLPDFCVKKKEMPARTGNQKLIYGIDLKNTGKGPADALARATRAVTGSRSNAATVP